MNNIDILSKRSDIYLTFIKSAIANQNDFVKYLLSSY
ncbi:Uncharacterised protein [Klebsiella pneumoniae]|nr:Uncharacterised protein [Klebsiella pneumoniae]